MSKYTLDEKQIVHKIEDFNKRQCRYRALWLEIDIKKLSLIHSLKGKYIMRGYSRKKGRKYQIKKVI